MPCRQGMLDPVVPSLWQALVFLGVRHHVKVHLNHVVPSLACLSAGSACTVHPLHASLPE